MDVLKINDDDDDDEHLNKQFEQNFDLKTKHGLPVEHTPYSQV